MTNSHKYDTTPALHLALYGVIATSVPGITLGMMHAHLAPVIGTLVFGFAIFTAAFVLTWAAEAAQVDISESLAVAILALLAVLPEYAVDFVFTWKAAHDPEMAHYAIANMTGANRLLIGLGWPVVLFLFVFVKKKKEIRLDESLRVEIFYLAMATLYSFTIPLKGSLNLIDTAILVILFALYARRAAQMETVEPDTVGPTKIIVNLPTIWRRVATISMFAWAGAVIFFVAEPFAISLIAMGAELGIDEFFLVQWLAPIASESPEFIVAIIWVLRGTAGSALKALISSKVNQWTLLVGTIPLVFSISSGHVRVFALDNLQMHELYLTAAQSLFAVAVLANLRLSRSNGLLLLVLFLSQLIVQQIRMEVAAIYLALALVYHIMHRRELIPTALAGLGLKGRG